MFFAVQAHTLSSALINYRRYQFSVGVFSTLSTTRISEVSLRDSSWVRSLRDEGNKRLEQQAAHWGPAPE
jgi:hypothetical protein